MTVAKKIHALSDKVDAVCSVICAIVLTSMVLITGVQIICRLWFTALDWSEEITRYLLVWATFIGAGCVYKRAGHINVTIVHLFVSPHIKKMMEFVTHLLCGAFFCLAAYHGYAYMNMQSYQLSAAMRIPMYWMYLAIPVGCGIMFLHVTDALLKLFSGACKEEEKAS